MPSTSRRVGSGLTLHCQKNRPLPVKPACGLVVLYAIGDPCYLIQANRSAVPVVTIIGRNCAADESDPSHRSCRLSASFQGAAGKVELLGNCGTNVVNADTSLMRGH